MVTWFDWEGPRRRDGQLYLRTDEAKDRSCFGALEDLPKVSLPVRFRNFYPDWLGRGSSLNIKWRHQR
jgi:hypothetical protein